MVADMHSSMPVEAPEGSKLRTVPLYKLKGRSVPLRTEESLIYAVYKRRPLWDPTVHFYRNNTVIKILWEEVANETGLTESHAKGRWKSLRDYYRLELKKQQKSGGEDLKKSNWAHFSSMSFLEDLMSPKKDETCDGDSHMTEDSQSSTEEQEPTEDIYIKDEEASPPYWRPLPVDSTTGIAPQPNLNCSIRPNNLPGDVQRKILIELERRKLELFERKRQQEEDDDLQYLKSLLPLVKMLPLRRKLDIRLKFQEIIGKELQELEAGK